MKKSYCALLLIITLALTVLGQSSGGTFQISQSVVANGGGSSTDGGAFTATGTAGEPGAGTLLRNPPFAQLGGFWASSSTVTPTAAMGSISGLVTTSLGLPVAGITMSLNGSQTLIAITDANGVYRFSDLSIGGFYVVSPSLVNFSFAPASRTFSLTGDQANAVFTANASAITANPLDMPTYFVRQQYLDFLAREPDQGGLNYWSNQISQCGSNTICLNTQRVGVAAAFFIAPEAQQTGSYIYDLYVGALGRQPHFTEYAIDRQQVIAGPALDAEKSAFAQAFTQRAEFVAKYQLQTSATSFVDALIQNAAQAGADISNQRDALLAIYNGGTSLAQSRALTVQALGDNAVFKQNQFNAAFVLTEYFSFLRRDPDANGYAFWLNALNRAPDGYMAMVCSFVTSAEYQRRFSTVVTHSNGECQ